MLLHYRFDNFKSFKDMAEFDMIAPANRVKKRFPDNFVSTPCGEDVLKSAVIVGENAGGKTNFIDSMEFLKALLCDNVEARSFVNLVNQENTTPEAMEHIGRNTEQRFELEVLAGDGNIYHYAVLIDWQGMVKEELAYRTRKGGAEKAVLRVKRVAVEDVDEEKFNAQYKMMLSSEVAPDNVKELLMNQLNQENAAGLLVPKLAILGLKHVAPFFQWIKNTLYLESSPINSDLYHQVLKDEDDLRILKDERYKDIFRMIDHSVESIEVDEKKPFEDSLIIRRDVHGKEYSRKIKEDSTGVRQFFAWAIQIFRVVYENKVVFADEMDGVLNPILSDRIVAFIHGKAHQGQFIFTTHNVLHLNLRTYMKEQLYFITRDSDKLESTMYSLADFPEVRYDQNANIYEFYLKGVLGGTAF